MVTMTGPSFPPIEQKDEQQSPDRDVAREVLEQLCDSADAPTRLAAAELLLKAEGRIA